MVTEIILFHSLASTAWPQETQNWAASATEALLFANAILFDEYKVDISYQHAAEFNNGRHYHCI